MIRNCTVSDAKQIADIYNHYIVNTPVTFEIVPVSPDEIMGRISSVTSRFPWIVHEVNGRVTGYAYANEWRARAAYKHTVELSIYLDHSCTGGGTGTALYKELIDRLKTMDLHTLVAGVTLPNPASVRLHEKFGFRKAAHFHEVGRKFGQWLDVGYWEMIIGSSN